MQKLYFIIMISYIKPIQTLQNKNRRQKNLSAMSFNRKNQNHNKHLRNSYSDTNRHFSKNNERERSRDNHNNFHNRNNNISSIKILSDDNNKNQRKQYGDSDRIVRQVFPVDIGHPKVYLVWKHDKSQPNLPSSRRITFAINIKKSLKPPTKSQPESSRLGQLKQEITPVEEIWGQLIKQYLNDSEFVQIYRKKNSLAYGPLEYSKTIVKYDGMSENKKFYGNHDSQYNIFSRAYFKLWEILSLGILESKRDSDITIANLAEGPGGFVHSLIDFRLKQNKTLQDRYYAITLKIQQGKTRNAKDWSDYRGNVFFQKITAQGYKVKLSYGQTGDGNLYNIQNIESFKTHVMEGREAFLVTGDGGIQCIGDDEFHYQEIFNAKLFFSEILTALRIQQIGGTFILKIYDVHFDITEQLIMLLCVFYRKVGLIKPLTSRPGNSEKYVLCEGFYGVTEQELKSLTQLLRQWHNTEHKLSYFQNPQYLHSILSFSLSPIAYNNPSLTNFQPTIRQRISLINTQLSKEQQTKIQQGLQLIKRHNGSKESIKREIRQNRLNYQVSYAYEWCRKYGVRHVGVRVERQQEENERKKEEK